MSGDTRRLHLRFSAKRPEQVQAYETISAIPPGQRMEYICRLINGDTRFQDMERHVISAVKQALSDYQPQIQLSKEENEAGEIPQPMMDFLATL